METRQKPEGSREEEKQCLSLKRQRHHRVFVGLRKSFGDGNAVARLVLVLRERVGAGIPVAARSWSIEDLCS